MITGITGITRERIAQHGVTNSRYFENCAFTRNLIEPGSLKRSNFLVGYIYIYLERNQILIRSKGSIIDSKSFLNFLKRIFITDKDENGKE